MEPSGRRGALPMTTVAPLYDGRMTTYNDFTEQLKAIARLVTEAPVPVQVQVGDPSKFFAYLRAAGIPMVERDELAGPNAFFGLLVLSDPRLPANMAVISDKLMMLPDPDTDRPGWIIDMSQVEKFLGPLR